ncbi:arylsulfatase [Tamlana sp. 2201CG12-4]|uniref:sulfatase family protein n=1 Tax=Tamlana sp. 2201CG12-4 TaxID=3112582 RepID=UPI002DBF18E7|nr:arylsulfatase [Tamlana sp. 2201CG12-4]MEC3908488.1 arylsulfatase [Tamlana sp. 2201CG12-4]
MKPIKQIFNQLIIVSSCLVISCASKEEKPTETAPNIIYVLADDLGYGDISVYNPDGKIKTPNLDKMASEGMRFTDAHTSSSVCTPTRYGIMTGRYNWRSTLKQWTLNGKSKALIPSTRTTVASMLKKQGYQTAFIGKWHLGWDWAQNPDVVWNAKNEKNFNDIDFSKPVGNSPNDRGFDYSYGHNGSLDMAPYVYVENGQPTAVPVTNTVNKGAYSWWREGPTAPDFVHEQVTPNFFDRARNYIKEKANDDKPFFLYLPLPSPHTPILPLEEWQEKSGLNPYADFMLMIDDYMGELLHTIKESGIEENTMIVFASDNGCSPAADIKQLKDKGHYPNGIYRGHKADIFEGGHRVPFIVKWPEKIKAGSISDEIVCLNDFMATVAAVTGYNLQDNEAEDSYNMLPVLTGETLNEPLREATVHHSGHGYFAIRKGHWKLAMCPGSGGWSFPRPENKEVVDTLPPMQLYNLKNDPQETKNLVEEYPDKVEELKGLLTQYIKKGRSTPGSPQSNDGPETWKQLWWLTENNESKQ